MFMDESFLDDDEPKMENLNKGIRTIDFDTRSRPKSRDNGGDYGSAGVFGGSSSTRSKLIDQQRELQKRKMQERIGGGMLQSETSPDYGKRNANTRQYSNPRSVDVDDVPR